MLARIQNDLFDLGADLCRPGSDFDDAEGAAHAATRQVDRLEHEIDAHERRAAAAELLRAAGRHRRRRPICISPAPLPAAAERLVCELAEVEAVNPAAIRYLNCLSDHLFVLSRWLNDKGAARRALGARSQSLIRRSHGN